MAPFIYIIYTLLHPFGLISPYFDEKVYKI